MVSVTLSHVIGTTALISVFIVTGMYYAFSYSSFETQIIAAQLENVADYISSNIIDLVSLCTLNGIDQLIIEGIAIPEHLNTNYFSITIVQMKDPYTQEWLFSVRAYLDSRPSILKDSTLPWSTNENLMIYNGTTPEINHPTLQPQTNVPSSSVNFVVWCLKSNGKTTIGLGTIEGEET